MPLNLSPELIGALVQRELAQNPPARSATAAPKPSIAQNGVAPWAKILYLAGAGLDDATTAYAMSHDRGYEKNPMYNWAPKPAVVPLMQGIDLGAYVILKKLLGDRHPAVLNAVVGGSGISHAIAGANNLPAELQGRYNRN
jgi:hypothetical protein